jgi:hypothetical protein
MPDNAYFPTVFIGNSLKADTERLKADMVDLGRSLMAAHSDVGAVVCECTNFVPFNHTLQEIVKVPVFDIVTLVHMVCDASIRKEFMGFL